MIRRYLSVNSAIDGLGGTEAVSILTGYTMPAVSNWRKRRRFPPGTFPVLEAAASIKGRKIALELFGFMDPEKTGGFSAWLAHIGSQQKISLVAMRNTRGKTVGFGL